MSNHTVDIIQTWVRAFVDVYTILIIAWIIVVLGAAAVQHLDQPRSGRSSTTR